MDISIVILDDNPGSLELLSSALAQPGLLASLIPDGLHLPEHAFRVLALSLQRAQPSRLLFRWLAINLQENKSPVRN